MSTQMTRQHNRDDGYVIECSNCIEPFDATNAQEFRKKHWCGVNRYIGFVNCPRCNEENEYENRC